MHSLLTSDLDTADMGHDDGVPAASRLLQSIFPAEGEAFEHYRNLERRVLALLHVNRERLISQQGLETTSTAPFMEYQNGAVPSQGHQANALPTKSFSSRYTGEDGDSIGKAQLRDYNENHLDGHEQRSCERPQANQEQKNKLHMSDDDVENDDLWCDPQEDRSGLPALSRHHDGAHQGSIAGLKRPHGSKESAFMDIGATRTNSSSALASAHSKRARAVALNVKAVSADLQGAFHSQPQKNCVHDPSYFDINEDDW